MGFNPFQGLQNLYGSYQQGGLSGLGNQVGQNFGNGGDPMGSGDPFGVQTMNGGQNWMNAGGSPPPQIHLPFFQEDRDRLGGLLNGHDPFASGDWNGLIDQLKARANGAPGTSMAELQYQQAQGDNAGQLSGMAHGGGNPAAFRQAAIQQGRIGQGMANGLAQAGLAERNSAQSALQGALGTRDQLNQNSYLNILGQQLGLSQSELGALGANQQADLTQQGLNNKATSDKYNAIAGLLGGGAKMLGGM